MRKWDWRKGKARPCLQAYLLCSRPTSSKGFRVGLEFESNGTWKCRQGLIGMGGRYEHGGGRKQLGG